MRSVVVAAIGLAGCGSVSGNPDAPVDGPPMADAAPLGPFGTPALIAELSTTSDDDDPTLTADLLEIIFDSSRPGGMGQGDFWTARRASVADAWSTPTLIAELASPSDDTTPEISPDGLTIYFGSNRAGPGLGREIYTTTRPSRTSPWRTPPIHLAELGTGGADSAPTATSDGLTMFFESDRAGSYDVFVTTRSSVTMPWGPASAVRGFDIPATDGQQWISDDLLTIYDTSDRTGGMAAAIWIATRSAPGQDFGSITSVTELDTAMADVDPWLSPDQRTIVFARQLPGRADFDLFIATR